MEKELKVKRDIIMLGIQPWDIEIGCNFKNMALEIAKQYRVLYVNRPLDRITAIKKKEDVKTINRLNSIKKGIGVLDEVSHNLWVFNPQTMLESINWMPAGFIYQFFNKRNNSKLASEVRWACDQLQFKNSILLTDNDFYNGLYLKQYIGLDFEMYYLRDYLLSQPYFYKHGVRSEPKILAQANVVTANSTYLADYAAKYNKASYYIGQGCEVNEFAQKPSTIPPDIQKIDGPIIGYSGALLSLRLDINLLLFIANKRPNWSLVLVGPEDEDFKKSALHQLPNVYFLGHKEPVELPAYVHQFDVCLNPQVVNQMTIGNYPRKIDEYLAAGKPIVATATPAMSEFKEVTNLCHTEEEYLVAIENALASKDDQGAIAKRITVARSHTWHHSVMKMYEAINKHLND